MHALWNFFSAPTFPDEETNRRAGLLSFLINLHIFVAVGTAFILAVFTTMRPIFPLAAFISGLPGLALRVLMHRGRVTLASIFFVGMIFLIMPTIAWSSGNSVATVSVTVFQAITIVMAGLLLNGRGAALFVVLTGAVNGVLIYAEFNRGYVTDTSRDPISTWILQVIAFSAISAMLYVTNRLIHESFARARRENDERRIAEAEVREMEQLYRSAIEAANAVPYYLNYKERTYDFIGNGILELTGYAQGEITQDIYNSLVKECHLLGEAAKYTREEAYQHVRNGDIAVWKTDNLITKRDGEERWLMDSAVQVTNERGKIIGAIGILQDVTERKQAERRMQQHIQELAVIHAVSQGAASKLEPDALFDLIAHELFKLFDIQEIYFALHDQQKAEVHFPYYRHGDQRIETSPIPIGQGLSSRVILSCQPLLINQDYEQRSAELGAVRFSSVPVSISCVSWLGVPIQAGEQVIGMVCVMNLERENAFTEADVRLLTTIAANVGIAVQNAQLYTTIQQELSERKQAEQKNAQTASQLAMLNEIGRAVSEVTDLNTVLEIIRQQLEKVVEFDFYSVRVFNETDHIVNYLAVYENGQYWDEADSALVPGTHAYQVFETGNSILHLLTSEEIEQYKQGPYQQVGDHSKLTTSIIFVPLKKQGKTIGALSVQRDKQNAYTLEHLKLMEAVAIQVAIAIENARLFTNLQQELAERKRAEMQIRQLNDELEQRVVERTIQLEAANKELEAFSYSVSHDLRAPLRAMGGFAKIIKNDFSAGMDPMGVSYVDKVIASGAKMNQLIDMLLEFSRTGRKQVNRQDVDLCSIVQLVIESFAMETSDRQIEWIVAELPVAQVDPALIHQVYVNLIGNAVKYTRPRSPARIEISCFEKDDKTVYVVRDNGVGFDMKYANKLFGVFQRLHSEADFEGTGIGLATVQRIIHRHGGHIWAEAEPDKGATFYFTLGL